MTTLRKLAAAAGRIDAAATERDSLIQRARSEGATWEQIAEASGMSRAGAIKAFNRRKA